METLMTISDLQVDRIIQQVLIRPSSQPYSYNKNKDNTLPQEHLWHFQLQEENMQLKEKIKALKLKNKRKEITLTKQDQLQQEMKALKQQLEDVLHQNQGIQRDINRLRVRNSQINETMKQQMQESIRSKSKRQCLCVQTNNNKLSPLKKQHRRKEAVMIENSPAKKILKSTENVSINCQLPLMEQNIQIEKRKEHIRHLKKVIEKQNSLIASYIQQLNEGKQEPPTLDKKTRPSMSRFEALERPSSLKTFNAVSSVGSIVKIKRR